MHLRARGGSLLVMAVGLALLDRPAEAGIHGLGPLLAKEAPTSSRERTLQDFQGKKLAIDASMAMYQFLIAVRVAGRDGVAHTLTSDSGDDTSHLQVCRTAPPCSARSAIALATVGRRRRQRESTFDARA